MSHLDSIELRFDIRMRLFVVFAEKGKGQHVTIDGLVANAFACLTLYVGEEGALALIRASAEPCSLESVELE